MKKCITCGIEKPLSEFGIRNKLKSGYAAFCKECGKIKSSESYFRRKQRPDILERMKAQSRNAYHRLNYKEKRKNKNQKIDYNKYRKNYPEKLIAKNLSQYTQKKQGYHLHHWSYNIDHVKDTIELEIKNHYLIHRYMIYDQEFYMYRRIDTMELLDTKIKHEEYILKIIKEKS